MKGSIRLFIGIILCIAFLNACDKGEQENISIKAEDFYVYPIEDFMGCFEVDQEGVLYYSRWEASGASFSYIDSDGKTVESTPMDTVLYALDADGNVLTSYNLGDGAINKFTIDQNKIYYTTSEFEANNIDELQTEDPVSSSVMAFYEYSMEDQGVNKLYEHNNLSRIVKMKVIEGKIYYLGIDDTRLNKAFTLAGDEDYYYSGEILGALDTATGNHIELPVDFPVSISVTLDNNLLIYAHDGTGGYYFTEYDTDSGILSDKIYKDIGRISEIEVYDKDNSIVYNSSGTSTRNLAVTTMKEGSGITEIMPYVGTGTILCRGDYFYYSNGMKSNRIERIRYKAYIREANTIHMLSSMNLPYTPFGCGYTLMREYPDAESFALSVLSQDESSDIYLMSSRESISHNIRDKGSFYPLNKVPGVKEYLESCFPYIMEAATTEKGDIWMLPISVDIPVLLYNEELCRKNGIDLSGPVDNLTFIEMLEAIRSNTALVNSYYISSYLLTENLFHQYLRETTDLNNEKFKDLALLLKKEEIYQTDPAVAQNAPIVLTKLERGETERLLFAAQYYCDSQLRLALKNQLRAGEFPYITEDKANIATSLYLTVNPASKNLKSALNYISSLCEYTQKLNNTMMFQDRSRYPEGQSIDDLYNIYQRGDIRFTMPSELFMNDYQKFLLDEINMDTLIKEANRKIDTYQKE